MKKILILGVLLAGLVSPITLKADAVNEIKASVKLDITLVQEQKFEEAFLRIPVNYKAIDADGVVMDRFDAFLLTKILIAARDKKMIDFESFWFLFRHLTQEQFKIDTLTPEQEKILLEEAKTCYQDADAQRKTNEILQNTMLPAVIRDAKLAAETLCFVNIKVNGNEATVVYEYESFADPLAGEGKELKMNTEKWVKINSAWLCLESVSIRK